MKVQFVVKSNTEKTYKSGHRAEFYSSLVLRWCGLTSAGFYFRCFETFSPLSRFIFDFLSVLKGPEAAHLDVRVMDEQIIAATIGSDESETLIFVEPFYYTCIQMSFSLAPVLGLSCKLPRFLPGVRPPRERAYSLPRVLLEHRAR